MMRSLSLSQPAVDSLAFPERDVHGTEEQALAAFAAESVTAGA